MNPGPEVVETFYALQRRFYAGEPVRGDLEALLSDEIVWHVPGRSPIAGDYRGREEVIGYFAKRREIANRTFRITGRGMLSKRDVVVHFADGEATLDGRARRWRTVGVFRISDGRIAECWLLPFDQYEFDEIWSGG